MGGASFSPDGTRILTGSDDGTAKVWDARTGTALLDLRGHTGWVLSASFGPDGTRILTGGADKTAKVWDARTGTALLELKGHKYPVGSASFSPDGTRILTGIGDLTDVLDTWSGTMLKERSGLFVIFHFTDHTSVLPLLENIANERGTQTAVGGTQTAKVWDARTGQELKGEPIPPETAPGPISPDGRSVAHPVGNRVEVMALNPDAEELEYRRFLTRPNPARYREGYDEAKKAGDEFAARFYFGLLPTRSRADAIVAPLFVSLLIRDDVIAALKARPADDPEVQAACLELAGSWTESALQCNNVVWTLVFEPGKPDAIYQRGLRLAKAACRLEPDNRQYLDALGMAQYRCGLVAEAIGTLTRSNDLNKETVPSDLAFLALAQHRLGQSEKARSTLGRLRTLLRSPEWAGDEQTPIFLREAETIELDEAFPADPFAH